jgi:outer membrane receptor protein involved in Fe transport
MLQTRIDEFPFDSSEGRTVNLAGNELSRAPQTSINAAIHYQLSPAWFIAANATFRLGYESDIFNLGSEVFGSDLSERIEPTTVVNFRIGYRLHNLSLELFATNVTDEDEPESINFAGAGILQGTGELSDQASFFVRKPRSFGLGIEVFF